MGPCEVSVPGENGHPEYPSASVGRDDRSRRLWRRNTLLSCHKPFRSLLTINRTKLGPLGSRHLDLAAGAGAILMARIHLWKTRN